MNYFIFKNDNLKAKMDFTEKEQKVEDQLGGYAGGAHGFGLRWWWY